MDTEHEFEEEQLDMLLAICEGSARRAAAFTEHHATLVEAIREMPEAAAEYIVIVAEQMPKLVLAIRAVYHEARAYVVAHDAVRRTNREQVARLAQAYLRAAHLRSMLKLPGEPEVKMAALAKQLDAWWAPVEQEATSLTEQVTQQQG